jgi:hypothetical protein
MKKILNALIPKQSEINIDKAQFESFAAYVNSLILKRMGFMTDSRLGILHQHTIRVK